MGSVIRLLAEQSVGADAVYSHATWRPASRLASIPLALRAAWGLLKLRRSDVIHVHVAENGSVIREGALVVLARLLGHATVVTIHGADFLPFARAHPHLTATVLRRALVITCLDPDVLNFVRSQAPKSHVVLMPNPIAMDYDAQGADETAEVVLFAGEIGLRKGVDVLQRAWTEVAAVRPHARCIMVGPSSDFVVPDTERLDVWPAVGPSQMRELVRTARVVALPSRSEGMPMILLEAMSAGRPFVSTPVGGIPQLAQQGGLLVPVDDARDLAVQLVSLLADPGRAREIGEQGQSFCAQTRSTDVVGSTLCALYRKALTAVDR
jgi:glycosyltransferase involved in cell wall biosynthesis